MPLQGEMYGHFTASGKLALLMDEWVSLAEKQYGLPQLPVTIINRRDHPKLSGDRGELNTAVPELVNGQPMLVVFLENTDAVNEILVAHEIMHWILNLNGFKGVSEASRFYDKIASYLTSLVSHVPLNRFMTERGFDYLSYENERATETLNALPRELKKPRVEQTLVWTVLYLCDVILNCSPKIRNEIEKQIAADGRINAKVNQVLSILGGFNLHDVNENSAALQSLLTELELHRFGTFNVSDHSEYINQVLSKGR
ncbi:MAG: hypothetical protein AABO57_06380 [Acidobacteriota bacterium]